MPSSELKIIFIDDSPESEVTIEDLKSRLGDQELQAVVNWAKTLDQALRDLRDAPYDLAIVDLRLDSGSDGNEIIRTILETQVLPIIIFSGYPGDLMDSYENHGLIFKAPAKKVRFVAEKILEWHHEGVFDFFSERGRIAVSWRQSLQRAMWDHVSRYWSYLRGSDNAMLPQIAGRIASTLFYDLLSTANEQEESQGETPIHHGEVYVFRSPRRYLAVGDLLEVDSEHLAVLTPACDLVPRLGSGPKANQVLVAQSTSLHRFAQEHREINEVFQTFLTSSSPNKRLGAQQKIEKMMRHSHANEDGRLFFLPPFATFGGGAVDFLKLKLLPYSGDDIDYLVSKRVLSLNREVASEFATRFGRFMIRLGQPAYHSEALLASIRECLRQ